MLFESKLSQQQDVSRQLADATADLVSHLQGALNLLQEAVLAHSAFTTGKQ